MVSCAVELQKSEAKCSKIMTYDELQFLASMTWKVSVTIQEPLPICDVTDT